MFLIYFSLASFWLILLIRQLIDTEKKPIACDLCMSFWANLLVVGATIYYQYGYNFHFSVLEAYIPFWFVFPAAGITYFLLKINQAIAPPLPPSLHKLVEASESKIVTK